MDIPFSRWYPAIARRRSRRSFDPDRPVETDRLAALEAVCRDFRPFPHARAALVNKPPVDIYRGIIGGYGKISGAGTFIAFIGDMGASSVHEETGYTGEGIILEATALGLNTCWVGGLFRSKDVASLVDLKKNERVLAVTPVGYAVKTQSPGERLMTGFGLTHRRLPLARLISGNRSASLSEWTLTSLEAARLAPSAVNRQPWGFKVDRDSITLYVRTGGPEFNISKRLDCGIAMLHIEVAALNSGNRGKWEFLEPPQVGRFTLTSAR